MANPTSSYLQTLPQDDALSFVESLQKVKAHLRGDLEWMSQQVEQKTLQLQGIEALLAEYESLDSEALQTPSTAEAQALESSSSDAVNLVNQSEMTAPSNNHSVSNGENQSQPSAISTAPSKNPAATAKPQPTSKNSKTSNSKSQPKARSSTPTKSGATTAKKTKPAGKSVSKAVKSGGRKELRDLLLPKFAGQSLTNVVAQVLAGTDQPLHLNQLLTEMYGILTDQDFQRAKVSLANVLSVGKKEGKWQNVGEGLYALQ